MTIPNRIYDRPNRLPCFAFVKLFSLQDLVEQFTSLHELHYEAVVRFVLEEIYESHDVWVVDSLHDFDLIFEGLDVFLRHFSFGENFDGHVLVRLPVLGLSNCGERPFTNSALNFVKFFDISEVVP